MTKEECLNSIWGVCDSCGRRPEADEVADMEGQKTFLLLCKHCSVIVRQTYPHRFLFANSLVRDFGYYPYSTIQKPSKEKAATNWRAYLEELDYFYCKQVGGVYPLIEFVIKQGYFEMEEGKQQYNWESGDSPTY